MYLDYTSKFGCSFMELRKTIKKRNIGSSEAWPCSHIIVWTGLSTRDALTVKEGVRYTTFAGSRVSNFIEFHRRKNVNFLS